jgi:trehalose 6-phosphate synthase
MNLVAKEYAASRPDGGGALILLRFAGAADELEAALTVNPCEPETVAETIYRALTMPERERRKRMETLRQVVRRNEIYWWLERYLRAAL